MTELNGSSEQLPAQDSEPFRAMFKTAQETGDFGMLIHTAEESHAMLINFRQAIEEAVFPGGRTASVAMGLNFLFSMTQQAENQLERLKQTEKATKDAIKATEQVNRNG